MDLFSIEVTATDGKNEAKVTVTCRNEAEFADLCEQLGALLVAFSQKYHPHAYGTPPLHKFTIQPETTQGTVVYVPAKPEQPA